MFATHSASFALAVIVAGLVLLVCILRVLRRQTYLQWPRVARVCWWITVSAFAVIGALGLTNNFRIKWGWPAAAWFLLAPLVFGLYRGWNPNRRR